MTMTDALNERIVSEEEIDSIPLPVGVAREPFKKAYNAAVEFYKKDSLLDAQDRLALYEAYSSIARAQLYGGWLGFSAIFITPFAYTFYKTNSIRGVKVPRNFVLGVVGMIFSTHLCGSYVYKSQLNTMTPANMWGDSTGSPEEMALKRRYEMMRLLEAGGPTKWANYFNATYQNPERRLPDPTKKLQEMKDGKHSMSVPGVLNQRDPIGLYSSRPKTQELRKSATSDGWSEPDDVFVDEKSAESEQLSPWDRVRQQAVGKATPQENTWDQVRKRNILYRDQNAASEHEDVTQNGSLFGEEDLDSMLEQEKHRIEKDM